MGRQFRFFISPLDANQLVQELRRRFGVKLLLENAPDQDAFEIEFPYRLNLEGASKAATPNSIPSFYLAPPFGRIDRNYYPKPDRWIIDTSSEGIQFSGCKLSGIHLEIGRFYYQHDVLMNMEILPKRADFVRWAEQVFRAAKSLLQYEPALMAYVGKEAIEFRKQGGLFITGKRPDGTVIPA
jgi:hypothetical protein